jgi:hypothetical protein
MSDAVEKSWWESLARRAGVYRLVALRDDTTFVPMPLNRVCGVDDTGTIYIGQTDKQLIERLGALVKTHRKDYRSSPHRRLSSTLAASFPSERLAFTWEYTSPPAWKREAELLSAYEHEFGELPPNNGQRNTLSK